MKFFTNNKINRIIKKKLSKRYINFDPIANSGLGDENSLREMIIYSMGKKIETFQY